jgi:hypothetical protein
MMSLKIKTLTLLHEGGQETIRYKSELVKIHNIGCMVWYYGF